MVHEPDPDFRAGRYTVRGLMDRGPEVERACACQAKIFGLYQDFHSGIVHDGNIVRWIADFATRREAETVARMWARVEEEEKRLLVRLSNAQEGVK